MNQLVIIICDIHAASPKVEGRVGVTVELLMMLRKEVGLEIFMKCAHEKT